MPISVGDIAAYLTLDDSGMDKTLSKNRSNIKKFEVMTEKSMQQIKSSFKIAAAGAAAMLASFTYGGLKAVEASSNLEEVSSKFSVVFSDQMDKAEAWSDTLVDSYAMSTRESKFFLSSVQDLLVPMGMASDKAGELSNEVVKLSADLGSFNNLPTQKVMEDIQSALVGNFETMKKYGVVLNATVVQEKALAMGLAATKDQLTAAHKAQAAYALMVEGSQAAIGDMSRTMEGHANQVKQMKANWEEILTKVGNKIKPFATEIISNMNDWYEANEKLVDVKIDEWAEKAKEALRGMKSLFEDLSKTIPPIVDKITGYIKDGQAGAASMMKAFHEFKASQKERTMNEGFRPGVSDAARERLTAQFQKEIAEHRKAAADWGYVADGRMKEIQERAAKSAEGVKNASNEIKKAKENMEAFAEAAKDATIQLEDGTFSNTTGYATQEAYNKALVESYKKEADQAARSVGEIKKQMDQTKQSTAQAVEEIKRFSEAVREASDKAEIITDWKGRNSSVLPLTEKATQMKGVLKDFANEAQKLNPQVTTSFTGGGGGSSMYNDFLSQAVSRMLKLNEMDAYGKATVASETYGANRIAESFATSMRVQKEEEMKGIMEISQLLGGALGGAGGGGGGMSEENAETMGRIIGQHVSETLRAMGSF